MKMKNKIIVFCCFALLGLTSVAYALPSKCLQAVDRKAACPHLIYKKAALAVALLNIEKGDVICICLSDLKALKKTAASAIERIDQQVTLARMAEKYQLDEKDILTLIKY